MICDLMFCDGSSRGVWQKNALDASALVSDLNLTAVVEKLCAQNADFSSYYLTHPCIDRSDALYRSEIMLELYENAQLRDSFNALYISLFTLRKNASETALMKTELRRSYRLLFIIRETEKLLLQISAVLDGVSSRGLNKLCHAAKNAAAEPDINVLFTEAGRLRSKFELLLQLNMTLDTVAKEVRFSKSEDGGFCENLAKLAHDVFGISHDRAFSIFNPNEMSAFDAETTEAVQSLDPALFNELANFYEKSSFFTGFLASITAMADGFAFYLNLIPLYESLKKRGICVCRPSFTDDAFEARSCTDISTAAANSGLTMIPNDISVKNGETAVLSGPNQGGKTIYLKCVGSVAHLACCGCLVCAQSCAVPFFERIVSLFPDEDGADGGSLARDAEKAETIFSGLGQNSFLLMNESFSGTRREQGLAIYSHYIDKLYEAGCTSVLVTHLYELPDYYKNGQNSLISLSAEADDGVRTYRIEKRPHNCAAYARDIAVMCGVTFEQLKTLNGAVE